MNNSSRYFENRECEFYPCHNTEDGINCLFCYCPMYFLDNCPGKYSFIEKEGGRIKNCTDCDFPHKADNYDIIMKILKKACTKS